MNIESALTPLKLLTVATEIFELPQNLFIYRQGTPINDSYTSLPSDVKKVKDLPERLFMGKINKKSFNKTKTGYTVRYISNQKDTYFELEFLKEKKIVKGTPVLKGHKGGVMFLQLSTKFRDLMKRMSPVYETKWIDVIEKELENYNSIVSLPTDFKDNRINLISFPDGYGLVSVLPVSFDNLKIIPSFISHIKNKSNFVCPMNVSLSLTSSLISYIENKCKPELYDAEFLHRTHFLDKRLVPTKMPFWMDLPNNVRWFSQWRFNYNLIIGYFLPDIFEVNTSLMDVGLIKDKTNYDNSLGEDLDNKLWIVNSGTEILEGKILSLNYDSSMRIFYKSLTNEKYKEDLGEVLRSEKYGKVEIEKEISKISDVYNNLVNEIFKMGKG